MKARRVLRESDEALKEGYGFANQREDCIKFETEQGVEVVKKHQLVETSSSWNREKFEKIIDEAIEERDEIPAIVFPRVNRFARNIEAAGYLLGRLRQNGLIVMFALEKLVVNNDASAITVLMFFIHSYQADEDGKIIKHSMLGGRDKLATEDHEIPNGMVMWPFDYMPKRIYGKIATGKPTINKERAAWVRKWANWILEEGIGLAEVCRRMNEAKVPTPRASRGWKGAGKEWRSKAARDILRSEQLIGIFKWKGNNYLEDGETVLTREQFEALQKRLDENRERRYYNATKYDYPPLRKMVFCGHHPNQIMYGKPTGSTTWYYCPQCRKAKRTNEIRCQVVWEQYQEGIKRNLLREERLIPAIRAQFNNRDMIDRLEQEIKAKGSEIQKWEDAKDRAFRMGMTLENYSQEKVQKEINKAQDNMQRLEAEKASLHKRLSTLREQKLNEEGIRRFCQLAKDNINTLTTNQWELLNKAIKLKVTVYTKKLITVSVALPPVRDTQIEFSRL